MGKGDKYRPVDRKKYDEEYDRIYSPKKYPIKHNDPGDENDHDKKKSV